MSDIKRAWKGHQFDYNVIEEQDVTTNYYVCLNQREMALLLGVLTPAFWRSRWLNLPEFEDFQWIVELKAKLLCANGCCDGVEECIKGSEGIREIIREIIKETTIEDPARPLGEGNPALDGCNPDVIFGGVTSLVDILNQSILDTLEIIEVATNPLESLNLIADNNPVSGLLASKLVEMIDWIIANIGENYAANYTIGLRDTYRCDLFCIWQNSQNCELTLADVALYFQSRVASAPSPLMDISEVLVFVFGGVWVGPEIVDIMHLMCLTLMTASDRIGWLPIGNGYGVELAIAVGLNNPDGDWALLCDPCVTETWQQCWLNGAGFDPAWTINNFGGGLATYNAVDDRIDGYKNPVVNGAAFVDMSINVNQFTGSISVGFQWNATRASSTDFIRLYVDGVVVAQSGISGMSGQFLTWAADPDEEITTVRIEAAAAVNSQGDAGYMRITEIEMSGDGASPFGASNCP